MLSNKPYLLRAFYQWIVDSACTPILVLDANHPRCKVPKDFAEGDEIVFNISTSAIRDLKMLNDAVEFKASFSGVIHIIYAPIAAVLAIYAEENGEGIFFDAENETSTVESSDDVVQLRTIDGYVTEAFEQGIINESVAKPKPILTLVE